MLDPRAVMVGDRASKDIVGANKLGMKTILLKWNNRYLKKSSLSTNSRLAR